MGEGLVEQHISLSGSWTMTAPQQMVLQFPGSVTEQGFGAPNERRETDHLTERYIYVGKVTLEKSFELQELTDDMQVLFYMERTRRSKVEVNGHAAGSECQLTTPHVYDITGFVHAGMNHLKVSLDNIYADMPGDAIRGSHMATEHTQTNWLGMLGRIEIILRSGTVITDARIYPDAGAKRAHLAVTIRSGAAATGQSGEVLYLKACGEHLMPVDRRIEVSGEYHTECLELEWDDHVPLWSEFHPELLNLRICLLREVDREKEAKAQKRAAAESARKGAIAEREAVNEELVHAYNLKFGLRDFKVASDHRHFEVNGAKIKIRSEANCAVFPMTGYAPMDIEAWRKLFQTYQRFGVNYVRFHSWCPPEAAFEAADELGLYLQPELCEWSFHTFECDADYDFYREEARRILSCYGNHPSLVALTWGNELRSSRRDRMSSLLHEMKKLDPTRLYAEGSNVWYGEAGINPDSDFVMAQGNYQMAWRGAFSGERGWIEEHEPAANYRYSEQLKAIDKPVISFEVGQFQIYPNYDEIERYTGVLEARNLSVFRERLEANGMKGMDKSFHDASGQLARECYRREIEAVMRTPEMAGFSLLGFQDFSGQGTALVGMIDAMGQVKRFADPAGFRAFCNSVVPLIVYDKAIRTENERVSLKLLLSNYGESDLTEASVRLSAVTDGKESELAGWDHLHFRQGKLSSIAQCRITLPKLLPEDANGKAYLLKLSIEGRMLSGGRTERVCFENSDTLYLYRRENVQVQDLFADGRVITTRTKEALERVRSGEKLLLLPELTEENLPESIAVSYIPDFWNYEMFQKEDRYGTLGLMPHTEHPLFAKFAASGHTDPRWWHLIHGSRAVDPDRYHAASIIDAIDNLQRARKLSVLYEEHIGSGVLYTCTLNILPMLQYAEVQAFMKALIETLVID